MLSQLVTDKYSDEPLVKKGLYIFLILAAFTLSGFFVTISLAQSTQGDIKIGLLVRDKKDISLINTAKLAMESANSQGGYKGRSIGLEFRSCDGPWGVGSKMAVDLIHSENVLLVVAALDGRNAHLAEQVAAKSHIVLLDALASDPTLSRAYVPWYYRMVPDDKQQAETLMEEIYLRKRATRVAMVSLDNYDGKMAATTFFYLVKARGLPEPQLLSGTDDKQLTEKIAKGSWDAILIAGTSAKDPLLNDLIASAGNTPIFAFQNIYNFLQVTHPALERVLCPRVTGFKQASWADFEKRYKEKYNESPSPSMAYVYDAIMLAIEAVRKFGPDSQVIKEGFKSLKYQGITGPVVFGSLGNREMEFSFNYPPR
ncbi:MAG: ABC transporter substrate-binding protein [Cyclobacteriaceae bacterium]|nr:ABC transporter substrate-binding protein [Cyclobacteriaceae bacterium]